MTQRSSATDPINSEPSTAGWDPIEVWRTRILGPRLELAQLGVGVALTAPKIEPPTKEIESGPKQSELAIAS